MSDQEKNSTDDTMRATSIWSLLPRIKYLYKTCHSIANKIIQNKYKEVILIDTPLINLYLAYLLKKVSKTRVSKTQVPKTRKSDIIINYIAPPELWLWPMWSLFGAKKILRKCCDYIVNIYPHEVEWYKSKDIVTHWHGCPYSKNLSRHKNNRRKDIIAILPGSRDAEIKMFLPIFLKVIKKINKKYPKTKFLILLTQNINQENILAKIKESNLEKVNIEIFQGKSEDEKYKKLSQSCIAITKAGTNTLELGLLNIPAIVVYKLPFLSYLLARATFMGNYINANSG